MEQRKAPASWWPSPTSSMSCSTTRSFRVCSVCCLTSTSTRRRDEYEVDLIKMPANGYYEVSAAKDKIVRMDDNQIKDGERAKSFHLDTYCFDSGSENLLFCVNNV